MNDGIFISYRWADSQTITGRIYDRLAEQFTPERVFKDVDNIRGGDAFDEVIKAAILKSGVLLVIIGLSWLDMDDGMGRRRLDHPEDLVRQEIKTALEHHITVIPVHVEQSAHLQKGNLPESLRRLADLNALPVRNDPDFHRDLDRLVRDIFAAMPDAPPPLTSEQRLERQLEARDLERQALGALDHWEWEQGIGLMAKAVALQPGWRGRAERAMGLCMHAAHVDAILGLRASRVELLIQRPTISQRRPPAIGDTLQHLLLAIELTVLPDIELLYALADMRALEGNYAETLLAVQRLLADFPGASPTFAEANHAVILARACVSEQEPAKALTRLGNLIGMPLPATHPRSLIPYANSTRTVKLLPTGQLSLVPMARRH